MGQERGLNERVYAPASGRFVALWEISDPTFNSGLMGSGFGVDPENGRVFAPVDGTVSMIFPTGHALGITTEHGLEVLIHIGIDTVNLKGDGFQILTKAGANVHAGEEIVRFDLELLKARGLEPVVITIFPNRAERDVVFHDLERVTQNSEVAVVKLGKADVADMAKYEYGSMCQEILEAMGGKQNIKNVFHCITRLRIVPVNRDRVDIEKLNRVKGLLKVIESSGQLQCVIGTTVPEVYAEFLEISGFKAAGEADTEADVNGNPNSNQGTAGDSVQEKKMNLITRGLNTLASCVTPGLYAIVAGGMIKGIISLITAIGLVSSKSDIITVLNAVGDAPFYFMPFIIGYAAAKRFKVKEIFGIMTAGILMYSTFLSPAEGVKGYMFGFFNIPAYSYKGSIFPVILSVWIFSMIYHFIDKRMLKNLRIVFSGALSFLIAAPLFLGFAAPLGNWIAAGMTGGFAWLFNHAGPFAGALFCGIIPLTIIFGIKGWSAVELQNLATLGYDYMLPNFFYSNLAVSGAVLGHALKMKPGEQRSAAISTGLVCILGITEPALYGIALPEKKPLYAAMAGGAIAGAAAMLLGVVTYAFSMPGITSIATYMDEGNNFMLLLIVMPVAWVSAFVISYVLSKKED